MSIPTENLDMKRAQLNELRLIEAHRRATVVKAYEVIKVENIQLSAPEQLAVSIRQPKPDNICRLIFNRNIQNIDRPTPVENFDYQDLSIQSNVYKGNREMLVCIFVLNIDRVSNLAVNADRNKT